VLFDHRFWPGIADGSVTVAFRRWKRPTVKTGGTLQSPAGLLAIEEVQPIRAEDVTDREARAAGYAGRAEVLAALRPEGQLYRVRFHRLGEDPRVELRTRAELDQAELDDLLRAFERLDWACPVLRLIAHNPGVVSTELAPLLSLDRARFKQRVRRLKALGLTESLKVGYRLSPRGIAVLERIDRLERQTPPKAAPAERPPRR
jgi:hypothetical protein